MYMHGNRSHAPPGGMGKRLPRSRTLTPTTYGETRENPKMYLLLLRAWMLWRSRDNGWASRDRGRQNHVDGEASRLDQSIKAMNAAGGSSGDPTADALLKTWVPDIA